MKCLMSGDRGFVGTHFSRYLLGRGWDVVGCDIATGSDCRDLFRNEEEQFDLVVHLAAIVGGRETIEGNPIRVATDLAIDALMFDWAVRTKQRRVVYFSSSAAYPIAYQAEGTRASLHEGMIDLNAPAMPDFTYGWAKLTGEHLAKYASQNYGLKVHVLRPFSGYGPGQSLDYPFPSFAQRARRGDDPFHVWGDGTAVRDFIHISDVVRGTMAVVDADYRGPVNLCTGIGTSFNELAGLFGADTLSHDTDRPVGVHRRVGDPTLMTQFHTPRVTLEEGVREALHGR